MRLVCCPSFLAGLFFILSDAFLRCRKSSDNETTAMMKAQFMSLWDGFSSSDHAVIIMGATNRPDDVDAAILRRMPTKFLVQLPVNYTTFLTLFCLVGRSCTSRYSENHPGKWIRGGKYWLWESGTDLSRSQWFWSEGSLSVIILTGLKVFTCLSDLPQCPDFKKLILILVGLIRWVFLLLLPKQFLSRSQLQFEKAIFSSLSQNTCKIQFSILSDECSKMTSSNSGRPCHLK